ncbi:hypothetical protein BDR04DRAFT_710021 [Suillus decipiens]|nr:hypothetical protein BDR04DRAFT_710021 [Suillus decipiens]
MHHKVTRDIDAGHAQFTGYTASRMVSHLNDKQHFQLVLDECLVDHSDHAVALTSLACMRLEGYIKGISKTPIPLLLSAKPLHGISTGFTPITHCPSIISLEH